MQDCAVKQSTCMHAASCCITLYLGKLLQQPVSISDREAHGRLDLDHVAKGAVHCEQNAALGHAVLNLHVRI